MALKAPVLSARFASCAMRYALCATPVRSSLPLPQLIQAPRPRARRREVKEHEAEQDRGVPLIEHRPESLRCVADEIGERHLTREQKRNRTGEESQQYEEPAERLQKSREPRQGTERRGSPLWHDSRGKCEHLARPELDEEKRNNDSQDAEQIRRPGAPLRQQIRLGHVAGLIYR